jgi:hypothetical protein
MELLTGASRSYDFLDSRVREFRTLLTDPIESEYIGNVVSKIIYDQGKNILENQQNHNGLGLASNIALHQSLLDNRTEFETIITELKTNELLSSAFLGELLSFIFEILTNKFFHTEFSNLKTNIIIEICNHPNFTYENYQYLISALYIPDSVYSFFRGNN